MALPSAEVAYLLELTNADRAQAGLTPLAFNPALFAAADGHSQWMIGADVFSHVGTGGSDPTERMAATGYDFGGTWASGENIAWASLRPPEGTLDDVRQLHEILMDSPSHRANILSPDFREVGIGIEFGEFQGWSAAFVTEDFAASSASPPAPTPTVVPASQVSADGFAGGHPWDLWFFL